MGLNTPTLIFDSGNHREIHPTDSREVTPFFESKGAPNSSNIVISKNDWPFNADVDGLKREYSIYCSKRKAGHQDFVLHVLLLTSNSWYASESSGEAVALSFNSKPVEVRNGVMVYPGALANGKADTYALLITDSRYSGVVLTIEVYDGMVDLSVTVTVRNEEIRYHSVGDDKRKNITISKNDQNFKGEKSALQGNFTIHCEAGSDTENVYLLTVTLYESNPWEVATPSIREIGSNPNSEPIETSESSQLAILSCFGVGIILIGFAVIQHKRREDWRCDLEVRLTQDS